MPELPISQPLAAPLGQMSRSIWDEDGPNFEEDQFGDFPCDPGFQEGPLTDAQVQALIASDKVAQPEPSSGTATPIMSTVGSSGGVDGTASPSASPSAS